MTRRRPVLFVSSAHNQSAYWAQQLGFGRREWRHASPHSVRGLRGDTTVYLVGTDSPNVREALDYLTAVGVEVILAEEMVV